jgi:hypothetical protein
MAQSKERLLGELLFRTNDGNRAVVYVYIGKSTFTLTRMMLGGRTDERSNRDPHKGDVDGYISEATLEWNDLERDGVEWKPSRYRMP